MPAVAVGLVAARKSAVWPRRHQPAPYVRRSTISIIRWMRYAPPSRSGGCGGSTVTVGWRSVYVVPASMLPPLREISLSRVRKHAHPSPLVAPDHALPRHPGFQRIQPLAHDSRPRRCQTNAPQQAHLLMRHVAQRGYCALVGARMGTMSALMGSTSVMSPELAAGEGRPRRERAPARFGVGSRP